MKFYANRSRVGTAGTAVALSAATGSPDAKIKFIQVSARTGNSAIIYFGTSGVSSTLGYELSANDNVTIDLIGSVGSLPFADFYADASANDQDIDWVIVTE